MTWYAASIVTVIKVKEGAQATFPVFEDIYLIEAANREAALHKAEAIGSDLQNSEGGLQYDKAPAKRVFLGIRKLRITRNPSEIELGSGPPSNGSEVTHCFFEIDKEEDLKAFAEGKRITVSYVDDDEL